MNTGTANIREIERAIVSYYSELAAGYSKPSAEEGSTIACVDAEVEFIELLNAHILHGIDLIEIYGKFYVSAFAQCEKREECDVLIILFIYEISIFLITLNIYIYKLKNLSFFNQFKNDNSSSKCIIKW